MALREVGGSGEMALYKNMRPGDVVAEGFYVGDRRGKFGPIYEILDETENIRLCPSNGHLRWKFEQYVVRGNYVQIVYDGMEEISKGKWQGTECHMFRVFVDPDRVFDGQIKEQDDAPATPAAPPARAPARQAPPPPPPPVADDSDGWGYGDDDVDGVL